jgi:hypothetical protein
MADLDHDLRQIVLMDCLLFAFLWAVMGLDSTLSQITFFLKALVTGKGLDRAISEYLENYGAGGLHLSTLLLYNISFYVRSYYYSNHGLTGKDNILVAGGFTLFSIGLFEIFWKVSYAVFQRESYNIIVGSPYNIFLFLVNVGFLVGGLKSYLFLKHDYKLYFCPTDAILLSFTVFVVCFWWFYPLPVPKITINGWSNTGFFPQTVYSPPNSDIVVYVPNTAIHLTNIICKALMDFTCLSIFTLKVKKKYEVECF